VRREASARSVHADAPGAPGWGAPHTGSEGSTISTDRSRRKQSSLAVRRAVPADVDEIVAVQKEVWGEDSPHRATPEMLQSRIERFSEGFYVGEVDGQIVGDACSQICSIDLASPPATWVEATDHGTIRTTHDPGGDTLFGVDICLRLVQRGRVIVMTPLVRHTYQLLWQHGLKRLVVVTRVPAYHEFADTMGIDEFLRARKENRHFLDPMLHFLMQIPGIYIVRVLKDFYTDPASCNYGVMLAADNPGYLKGR